MKIAFGMIVFQSDFVLKQCLQQIYPFAEQILIAEGPVRYWQDQGFTTSTDRTNEILDNFPDPAGKITVVHGQFEEKDDECNAYMSHLRDDIDFLWQIDSDELYHRQDVESIIAFLKKEQPTSVGVKPISFYGGFDDYVTGFEQATDNFLRIFRVTPGSTWATHRPPTMTHRVPIVQKHVTSDKLYEATGAMMYHYSYVFPSQVKNKIEYYRAKVARHKVIFDYFNRVYLFWKASDEKGRKVVERLWQGVHEFKPEYRGPAFTAPFEGTHPSAILDDWFELRERCDEEFLSALKGEL